MGWMVQAEIKYILEEYTEKSMRKEVPGVWRYSVVYRALHDCCFSHVRLYWQMKERSGDGRLREAFSRSVGP